MKIKTRTVRLRKDEVTKILATIPPKTQAYRITKHLLNNRQAATGELCAQTSSGNISEIVRSQCNPRLERWGLVIRCELPDRRIMNQFMQKTLQHVWGVYRVSEAEERSMAG